MAPDDARDRIQLAWEMSEAARELLRARLRSEHRDWTERGIAAEVGRLALRASGAPSPGR